MVVVPGDIVLIPFPFSDLSRTKHRPVLVISSPDGYGDFIAVAMTTRPNHLLALPLTQEDMMSGHLPEPTWIRVEKVFSLNSSMIKDHAGHVTDDKLSQVVHSLCQCLGSARGRPLN